MDIRVLLMSASVPELLKAIFAFICFCDKFFQ